jgi:DNA-binding protein WhiA
VRASRKALGPAPADGGSRLTIANRDLVGAIRAELAGVEPARRCCRLALGAGLGAAGARSRSRPVGRMALRLASDGAAKAVDAFDWPAAATHCRMAYLRGLFLARGSLSLAGGRIHLEFVVSPDELEPLGAWLAEVGLPAHARIRRGRGVLTWKGAEPVIAFLRRAGGTAALLELETLLVTRTLHGQLNRAVNAESANLRRSISSSRRQLASINALAAAGGLERMPRTTRALAGARLNAPEASLTELARALGISRGHVQRGFEQLEERALHLGAGE